MSPSDQNVRQNADENAHENGRHVHTVPPRSALRSRCSSSATAATEDLPASEVDELADAPVSDQAVIAAHDNSALLHALAVCDFNPMALAEHLGVSPFALLDWYDSEEIQSQLERYHNLDRQLLELRAFKSRRLTIEHLEHVLETTNDLIEKRRTATTLLRVLSSRVGPSLRDGRAAPSRSASPSKHTGAHTEPRRAGDQTERPASDHGTSAPRTRLISSHAHPHAEPQSNPSRADTHTARPETAPIVVQASRPASPEANRPDARAAINTEQSDTLRSREAAPLDSEGHKAWESQAPQAEPPQGATAPDLPAPNPHPRE